MAERHTGPSDRGSVVPEFEVTGLSRSFERRGGRGREPVHAVDDVTLTVVPGQRLGIVGGSGSGKSTLVRMLLALLPPTGGRIVFRGLDITGLPERDLGTLRRHVQMVFQDPRSSLDPRMRVGRIIGEPLRSPILKAQGGLPPDSPEQTAALLAKVGLEPGIAARYPHELSGGQRQRVAIARALAPAPSVLVADEAVSSLDVSVRAQVLNLLLERVRDDGLTLLFVSHDIAVVRHLCDSVLVMQGGRAVEAGPIDAVCGNPQHPYTRVLLDAVPTIHVPVQ
ncbi:MAG: ATP-binding cassette domain-containing protein [Actinomycetia bacterium]|nr:ATP-binding cassette domain-containing protein [Actinomycetes bacterium]